MREAYCIIQQAVIDRGSAAHQKVVEGILETDVAVGLCRQRVLGRALYAGESADQVSVHYAGADEGVAVVDVLHYYLVASLKVIGIRSVAGARHLPELPGGINGQRRAGSDVNIEVRAEVVAVEKRPGVGAVVFHRPGNTLLAEVAEGNEVFHLVGATAHVQVRLILRGHSVEHLLVEVMVGVVKGRGVLELLLLGGGEPGHSIHLLRSEVPVVLELPEVVVVVDIGGKALVAGVSSLFVAYGLVAEEGVFVGGGAFLQQSSGGEAVVAGEVDNRLAGGSALGGDYDDTVRTAHTIDCRGGCVLQDADALYLVGIHSIELFVGLFAGLLDPVDDDERGGVAVGRDASDVDVGSVAPRFTGGLEARDAGGVAYQGVGDVRHRCGEDVAATNGTDGAGDVHLFLGGECGHHNLLHQVNVRFKHYVEKCLPGAYLEGLRQISDEGCLQHHFPGRHLQGVVAVDIRHRASRGSLQQHGGPHQRFSRLIGDLSVHRPGILRHCREHRAQQQCQSQGKGGF